MQLDKFTLKSQEAIQAAQQLILGLRLLFRFVRQRRCCTRQADQLLGQIVPAVGGKHGAV